MHSDSGNVLTDQNQLSKKGRTGLKTIFRIFKNDFVSIGKRFFALFIMLAICVLPALYAWVNIYANSNPYTNTGNIKIAAASDDRGISLDDGSRVNMADEVLDDLRTNDKIDWQFPESTEDAIEGVRSGKYYAAVVFGDNFTYNMYHIDSAINDSKAPITYYENAKKNAVASKITETAASNLQETIKTKYLEKVFGVVFEESNETAGRIEDLRDADTVTKELQGFRDTLDSYDRAISSFRSNSDSTRSGIKKAGARLEIARAKGRVSVKKAQSDLTAAKRTVDGLRSAIDSRTSKLKKELEAMSKLIDRIKSNPLDKALRADAVRRANVILGILEDLRALIPDKSRLAVSRAAADTLDNMIDNIKDVRHIIEVSGDTNAAQLILDKMNEFEHSTLVSGFDAMLDTMDTVLKQMSPLVASVSSALDDVDPVLNTADETVADLDTSLEALQKQLHSASDRLGDVLNALEGAGDDEKIQMLIDLLNGDPELYGRFFSALVDVQVEEVWHVASYGAAMAPFYSVLALWVGGVMLISILKTHVDREKYPEASDAECYFGRFLLFWLIGQVQAAVIVLGDIYLLGCSPVHPVAMWLAASVASFVFVLLIYSLTLSFGDIGKAVVVVVMVVQIAGSSGSYPIEILPEIFGKIYKFFPFPYAINAIREGLCGMYRNDIYIYLGQLLIFAAAALAIGLVIRKPFMGLNDFVSEKIEESEVL